MPVRRLIQRVRVELPLRVDVDRARAAAAALRRELPAVHERLGHRASRIAIGVVDAGGIREVLARVVQRHADATHPPVREPLVQRHLDAVIVGGIAGHVGGDEAVAAGRHDRRVRDVRRHVVGNAAVERNRAGEAAARRVVRERDAGARRDRAGEVAEQPVGARVAVVHAHSEVRDQLAIDARHDAAGDGGLQRSGPARSPK